MSEPSEQRYRIVVGFDGSEGSRRALVWAAEEARVRGAAVEVVRAWHPGEFGTDQEMEIIAQKTLETEASGVIGVPSGFEVTMSSVRGAAARVLVEHARDADMLVVGSRGHGGFTGLLLGSVSQQVTTHASAPVVVIVKE